MIDISSTFKVGDQVFVNTATQQWVRAVIIEAPVNGRMKVDLGFQDERTVPLLRVRRYYRTI